MRLSGGRRYRQGYDAIKLVAACCTFILIDGCFGGLPMNIDKKTNLKFKKQKSNSLEDSCTYQVDGKVFIVTPVFRDEASETLGDILLKLMKTENAF